MLRTILALAVVSASQAMARADAIAVGVARVDITPEFPIRLHGYAARSTESTGVERPISARAIALGDDRGKPLVLVTVDSLGVPAAVVEEVTARMKARAGVDRERFAVAASHTHSAPMLTGIAANIFGGPIPADQAARIDRYTRELTDKLESVSLAALKDREPGSLHFGRGRVGFAANRRTPGGPVDHDLPVLYTTGRAPGIKAILAAYACHCTTLDPALNRIDADWAGYARDAIEADHPGSTALIVIGCGADANPAPRGRLADAKAHGRALADEVRRVIGENSKAHPVDRLEARFERIKVPLDTLPTREQFERLVKAGGAAGSNAKTQLDRLDRGEPLQDALDYPVQCWAIDDAQAFVFLAGEVVVDYATRLKEEFERRRLWVVAYTNDVPCYIPSERILREGGYEGAGAMVYYGLPTRLKPGVEAAILGAVRRLVPREFAKGGETPGPKGPDAGLRSIRVRPGLEVELVAAEPLVVDPVAIDWGTDGTLWVCEMHDYPAGLDGKYTPGGRIKALRDTDGDGRYDRATVFLDGIPFPTGVMAWRKGVLVCAAPEIIYAEDADGDGKADVRKVLFRGFATENYQARVNGLAYGLDNWVYGANGLIGGVIRGEASGKLVDIGGRDFRIRPDSGAMEPAAGLTQQGRARDDWGNQFGGNNSVLIQHYPLPDHYARRNPHVAAPAPAVYVPRDPDNARLYPISEAPPRFNEPEAANRVTSACSPCIYRDDLLGAGFAGNAFVCEPVHNLVHREVLAGDGVTFAGHRAADERDSEFLASTDPWFRPVQVRTGPDGALYVVDMYRAVIEHPRWISPEVLKTLDVRAGDDKGRIYRVVLAGRRPRAVPVLDDLPTPRLAEALDSPNGTLRDDGQRLLVHRADPEAVPTLEHLAAASGHPACRVQALGTLDGLGALKPALVLTALGDDHPGVRAEAARLAESRLGEEPRLGPALARLVDDPSPPVRFQAALSLGEWDDARAGRALGRLAVANSADPWIVAAVDSSATRRPGEILAEVLAADLEPRAASAIVGPLVVTAGAREDVAAIAAALAAAKGQPAAWRLAALADLLDAIPRAGRADLAAGLRPVLESARALARDDRAAAGDRSAAARLLGRTPGDLPADLTELADLLDPGSPAEVQRAAVAALARIDDPRAAARLLAGWPGLGPALRLAALDALLPRREGAAALIGAIERGEVARGEVDAAHRQRLLAHEDVALRRRAAALWSGRGRPEILKAYREAATRPGDPARGTAVFGRICAACHRLEGQGVEVGPDLAALTDRSPEALLTAILDPNREVDARYVGYVAALTDGRVLTGMIAAETGNAITLKRQGGQQDVILRTELEGLKGSGLSLMPEGLERDLTPADCADLIAFVARGAARPGTFAGNAPRLVTPTVGGTIRLDAAAAEIYGPSLAFEPEFANLGLWRAPADRAAWSLRVDRPGRYAVSIAWACADGSAGNGFLLRVGGQTLRGKVAGTGPDWSTYRVADLGTVELPAGESRLEVRPDGAIRGALMDLKAVELKAP